MEYTAIIRTLGRAGAKYQATLDSLARQTLQPAAILVYIAEGYALPAETIGRERYIRCPKGMVAQRALPYDEVDTEWCLFLDDDVSLPPDGVERLYAALTEHGADVVSPDVFPNADRPKKAQLMMALVGKCRPRYGNSRWGYKIMRGGGYSYNARPRRSVYESQTNAGPCFMCRKQAMLNIHFEEELWMDKLPYALGEDQVMYYKMYRRGYKILTVYDSGIVHLDAGSTVAESNRRERDMLYADFYFKYNFCRRFVRPQAKWFLPRWWSTVCFYYAPCVQTLISRVKGNDNRRIIWRAIGDARQEMEGL